MKKLVAALIVTTALVSPTMAAARDVTVTAQMTTYRGNNAFLAIYVTDAAGALQTTLYIAGRNTRYYRNLRGWARAVQALGRIDGVTGASVGSGRTLTFTATIADALIEAGYQIRVDSAVEHGAANAAEIVIPLTQASAGVPFAGIGYVASMTVAF